MDRLLSGREDSSEDEDFYAVLGCDVNSTSEQIATEFKVLARKHHPDKITDPLEKDKAEQVFVRLERAREVLLDEGTRVKYDEWRGRGFQSFISFENWLSIQSRVHTSMHWASATQQPSLPGPERGDSQGPSFTPTIDYSPSQASSLKEFRKGSENSSALKKFRDYQV